MNLNIKDKHRNDRIAFGYMGEQANEELDNLSDREKVAVIKMSYDGNDKALRAKFVDPPTHEQVNTYFDKAVMDKTSTPAAAPTALNAPAKEEPKKP